MPVRPVANEAPAIPCIDCGYDLRGSPAHGKCPECGVDVWKSLHGGRLDHVDPKWLRRVVLGQVLICWSWTLLILFILTAVAALLLMLTFFNNSPPPVGLDIAFVAWLLGLNAIVGGAAVGAILVVWPHERDSQSPHFRLQQFVARWGFCACAIMLALIETRQGAWVLPAAGEMFVLLTLIPAWLICASCLFAYLAGLARRLPRENVGAQLGALFAGHRSMFARLAWTMLALEAILALVMACSGTWLASLLLVLLAIVSVPVIFVLFIMTIGSAATLNDLRAEMKRAIARR